MKKLNRTNHKQKHRGKTARTPRKLKKDLAKRGLVDVWIDLDEATMDRLARIAEIMGLPNPDSDASMKLVASIALEHWADIQKMEKVNEQ